MASHVGGVVGASASICIVHSVFCRHGQSIMLRGMSHTRLPERPRNVQNGYCCEADDWLCSAVVLSAAPRTFAHLPPGNNLGATATGRRQRITPCLLFQMIQCPSLHTRVSWRGGWVNLRHRPRSPCFNYPTRTPSIATITQMIPGHTHPHRSWWGTGRVPQHHFAPTPRRWCQDT